MRDQDTHENVTITMARAEYINGELIIHTHQYVGTAMEAAYILDTWEDDEESSTLGIFVSDQWRGMSAAADKARRIMTKRQGRA